MSGHPAWGDLPALALTEIYSYLSSSERLQASATCWHWRSVLFQPRFFGKSFFAITSDDDQRSTFYLQQLSRFVNDVVISFNSCNFYDVDLSTEILNKLSVSRFLENLTLRPKYAEMVTPGVIHSEEHRTFIYEMFIKPIGKLLNRRHPKFKRLDLGCSEAVIMFADDLLQRTIFPEDLEMLALATIKEDPGHYALSPIEPNLFKKFTSLQILSIDYDYMSEEFLESLDMLPIKRLIIHVHGLYDHHIGISEDAWANFAEKHPTAELHLTLVYAYEAVEVLHSQILRSSMPLTHLKVLFCTYFNIEALEFLTYCASETLKSLVWIDSSYDEADRDPMVLSYYSGADPLIMLAWRCKHLEELVIHGYNLRPHNLVGIAKLRGRGLHTLEVSSLYLPMYMRKCIKEVSAQMGQNWAPISKANLNPALGKVWIEGARDKYVLKLVRRSLE